jgi:hypothetical protein
MIFIMSAGSVDFPFICYNSYNMTDVSVTPNNQGASNFAYCKYVNNNPVTGPVDQSYEYTGFSIPAQGANYELVLQPTLTNASLCTNTPVEDDPMNALTGDEMYTLKVYAIIGGVGVCFWYKIDPIANPNEKPMACSGYISTTSTVSRLPDVTVKAPSGNCVRRCGTIGWGRPFGYKAEEEVAESVSEEDKYFMAPVGFNQGWHMMPAMGMGFGFPPITPWGRPMPPPPPPFFGWNNPFYMAPWGPPTPGYYAPPANQEEANNNRCMSGFQGGCRCSCDDDCTDNGDCCSDYSDQCGVVVID